MSTILSFTFDNGKISNITPKNDPGLLHLPGISDSFRLNCASESILKTIPWNGESVSLSSFWAKVLALIESSPKNVDGAKVTKITLTESSADSVVPLVISLTPLALQTILGIVNDPNQFFVTSRPPRTGAGKKAKVIDSSKWNLLDLEDSPIDPAAE